MRSLTLYRLTLICVLWIATALPALAEQRLHGRPAQIINGNELLLIADDGSRYRVRLIGIALPQPQRRWGAAAGRHLQMLVMGQRVELRYPAQRMTGTLAGRLLHGGTDVNRRLLAAGLARFQPEKGLIPQVASDYRQAEKAAQQAGLGVWREGGPAGLRRLP